MLDQALEAVVNLSREGYTIQASSCMYRAPARCHIAR
jgi:hypothetical protein